MMQLKLNILIGIYHLPFIAQDSRSNFYDWIKINKRYDSKIFLNRVNFTGEIAYQALLINHDTLLTLFLIKLNLSKSSRKITHWNILWRTGWYVPEF